MKNPVVIPALFLLLYAGNAQAKCENLLQGLDGAAPDLLVSRYKQLIQCDNKTANQEFQRFMRASEEADTLVALSLTAIEANIWNPVWEMIGKLTSYEARDEVADRVGRSCANSPKVVAFLKGSYFALRDIEFGQWDDALVTCESTEFQDWLLEQVEKPPPKLYDDKWGTLMIALVRRMGTSSLPYLAKAGVTAAGNGGPLEAILTQMDASVAPELGEEMSPENRKLLEETLVGMARQISPDKAFAVADRLANSGSEPRAAELLPVVYPNRKIDGGFLWGGASVELATCEGQKQAIVHIATIKEPGKRWIVLADSDAPLKAFKPRLKCKADDPWPVIVSPEPLRSAGEISSFTLGVVKSWEEKGYVVKTRDEKEIVLP